MVSLVLCDFLANAKVCMVHVGECLEALFDIRFILMYDFLCIHIFQVNLAIWLKDRLFITIEIKCNCSDATWTSFIIRKACEIAPLFRVAIVL